ncbi:MAG TPA: lipopolysaccharide transport periplasmic protein LptA [Gammaproteobacteria bacterium]|nr:lipopolysaccharide transport periplasmic protein LptA [Gammaproteobacteria bacterium]
MYCICAIAAPDAEMPIAINSDQANFDHKHGIATYTGRVTVKQGTRDLHANKLVIQRDESNKIKVMIATGNPAVFSSQANTAKPGSGKANIIKYYPQANKVDLFENASLTQNGDTVTGPQLTYNFVTEELQSKHTQKERTTVILQPKRVP